MNAMKRGMLVKKAAEEHSVLTRSNAWESLIFMAQCLGLNHTSTHVRRENSSQNLHIYRELMCIVESSATDI